MSNEIPRYKIREGMVGPATLQITVSVPIVSDNIICVHCKKPLGENSYLLVSSPKHKGLLAFACNDHARDAMAIISAAFGNECAVGEVRIPKPNEN